MPSINPYLNFPGNTEEAFNFYKGIFGGEFMTVMRFKEGPESEKVPEHLRDKIMHIALPIGNNILMGTDAVEEMGFPLTMGNNSYISINADSLDEAKRIFDGLSAGGKVEMPFDKVFWGGYFGSLKDKFGAQWMMSFDDKAGR